MPGFLKQFLEHLVFKRLRKANFVKTHHVQLGSFFTLLSGIVIIGRALLADEFDSDTLEYGLTLIVAGASGLGGVTVHEKIKARRKVNG